MKEIYDAVRALAYPKEDLHQAGVAFAKGSFRAPVREALRTFERTNRGNRHRLDTWELSANARNSAAYAGLEPENWVLRERVGTTFIAMANALLQGYPHPNPQNLERLLNAKDTSGWLRTFIYPRIGGLLQNAHKLGLHKDFQLIPRFSFTDQGVSLKLRICYSKGRMEAERDAHINVVVQSLNDVVTFENEAKSVLSATLKNVLAWPEFAPQAVGC